MKRKLIIVALMALLMVCFFAFTVNAQCAEGECVEQTVITLTEKGYLGKIDAYTVCTKCDKEPVVVTIQPMFETLGYSYNENGSIIQHYGVNRESVAKYKELTGETVKFGAVTATRNHVAQNPLNNDGTPISDKVLVADFTDTIYDVFDVKVSNIPDGYRENTDVICCAYIVAGGKVTYIENGVEKNNASANSFKRVTEKVENKEKETPALETIKVINGVRYKVLSLEEMGLTKYAFWQSDNSTSLKTEFTTTSEKFFATRKFERSELPNGTIIVIGEGWQYRPEAWIDATTKNNGENAGEKPRPKTVSTSVIINDSWWDSKTDKPFTFRGFNITPGSAIPSTITDKDIYEIFQIYVPIDGALNKDEGAIVPPPAKSPEKPFDSTEDKTKQDWNDDGSLKILCIGNSFSVDSMEYVYQVAESLGIKKIVLGNLYIGGCSLKTHLTNATNDSASYTYYKNTNGIWTTAENYKISTAVKSDDWDFISFQQASGYSGVSSTYADLENLIQLVEPLNPSARLVWHMTWAYQQDSTHGDFSKYENDQETMYNAILSAVKDNILTNSKIEYVIPAGTAIQNARTSFVGDKLTRDGYHLSFKLGRYIGSLTFVKALLGLEIDNIEYATDGITAEEKLVAIESVNNAILKPYEITNSIYLPTDSGDEGGSETPENPGGEGGTVTPENPGEEGGSDTPDEEERLVLVDYMGWQPGSYWYSTDSAKFNYRVADADNSPNFWATRYFTKEQLPVGSVIEVASGWQYRPEGWKDITEKNGNKRPDNVTTASIIITEEWWGNYTVRAFNLSKTSGGSIKNEKDTVIAAAFKIYVPASAYEKNQEPGKDTSKYLVNEDGLVKSEMCVSKEETVVINGKEYRALTADAMGLTLESYYWSEKLVNQLYTADIEKAKQYFSTRVFERDELVDGALIWVESGWQYRPEGWEGNKTNTSASRPGNTSETVEIDANWWDKFTTRAFNVSMGGNVLSERGYDTIEEVYAKFKIYIPVDMIAE